MEVFKNKFWILTLASALAPVITVTIAVTIKNIIKKRGENYGKT